MAWDGLDEFSMTSFTDIIPVTVAVLTFVLVLHT